MSRTSYSICETCQVFQYNGVGLNWSLLDYCSTLAEFRTAIGNAITMTEANGRIYDFLVHHDGHEIRHWSDDWAYDMGDPTDNLKEQESPRTS